MIHILWYFGVAIGYLFLSTIIGVVPIMLLFGKHAEHERKDFNASILLASMVFGFLLVNLMILNLCLIFNLGAKSVALPALIGIIALEVLYTANQRQLFHATLQVLSQNYSFLALLLLAIFPLASLHICYPLVVHGHIMSYATSNDGAVYLRLIDDLQKNVWTPQAAYSPQGRPLMQYAVAGTEAIFSAKSYYAYSITASIVATLSACSLGLIIFHLFGIEGVVRKSLALLLAAAFFGLSGLLQTYYYDGSYLGQYYGVLCPLFSLSFVYVAKRFWKQFIWYAFASAAIITMYSIGQLPIPTLAIGGLLLLQIVYGPKEDFRANVWCMVAAVFGVSVSILLYHYDLNYIFEWAATRNVHFTMENIHLLLIYFGVYSKYWEKGPVYDFGTFDAFLYWGPLVVLAILAVYHAYKFRKSPLWILFLIPVLFIGGAIYLDQSILLNRSSDILFPLLAINMIGPIAAHKSWIDRAAALLGVAAFVATMYQGYILLEKFYVVMVNDRRTYIDQALVNMKNRMLEGSTGPKRIFCVDFTVERHPLLQFFFREFEWQPVRNNVLWPELRYDPKRHPAALDKYDYDYVLEVNDMVGPADMESGNEKSLIQEDFPLYLYDRNASVVDFDFSFEWHNLKQVSKDPPASKGSFISTSATPQLLFTNRGNHKKLSIEFQLLGTGNKAEILLNGVDFSRSIVRLDRGKKADSYKVDLAIPADSIRTVDTITFKQRGSIIVSDVRFHDQLETGS